MALKPMPAKAEWESRFPPAQDHDQVRGGVRKVNQRAGTSVPTSLQGGFPAAPVKTTWGVRASTRQ